MINVRGVLTLTANVDGGVDVEVLPITGPGDPVVPSTLVLTGEEWKHINDLLRQEAKIKAVRQQAEQDQQQHEGITWTP